MDNKDYDGVVLPFRCFNNCTSDFCCHAHQSQFIVKDMFSSDKRVKQGLPTPPRPASTKSIGNGLSPGSPNCQIPSLSFKDVARKGTRSPRRLTVDSLCDYLLDVVGNVYGEDRLGMVDMVLRLVDEQVKKFKNKIQQRLSLLGYMVESLKCKGFAEIDHEMQHEWKKNYLFRVVNSLWCFAISKGKVKSADDFVEQYNKYRKVVASLTHFYYKDCLEVLENKNQQTYQMIFNDTAHHVITNCKQWSDVHNKILIPLFQTKKHLQDEVNFDFDLKTLQINPKYINLEDPENMLPMTTETIGRFAEMTSLKTKIETLREMRKHFIAEITQSRCKIANKSPEQCPFTLEKDDIIDCMIYCIIKGQITSLARSLEALMALLGRNSDLLGRKGVDSYRTDLQSAVMYLSQDPLCSSLVMKGGREEEKE